MRRWRLNLSNETHNDEIFFYSKCSKLLHERNIPVEQAAFTEQTYTPMLDPYATYLHLVFIVKTINVFKEYDCKTHSYIRNPHFAHLPSNITPGSNNSIISLRWSFRFQDPFPIMYSQLHNC